MSHTLKSPSLGRNPSSDYIKRRKSWSLVERSRDTLPDVRNFLGTHPYSDQLLPSKREVCSQFNWRRALGLLLAGLAISVLAGIIVAALAISFHSGIIYSQWLSAKDGTTYYFNNFNRLQFLILLATFFGAAVIVVAAYAVFCIVLSTTEGKRKGKVRHIVSLRDIQTGDLELGDTHSRTKQSIAKLMSDAERQYVAEYAQKSPSAAPNPNQNLTVIGHPVPTDDCIKVQQLHDGASGNSVGLVQGRSWSLKRMWSGNSRQANSEPRDSLPKDRQSSVQDPNEMAAKISSPDAFNRVGSHTRLAAMAEASRVPGKHEQEADLSFPSTPTRGDAIRQRREIEGEASASTSTAPEPRILVTIPVEQHGEGSAASDSEEDFDKGRQHSTLPHKAGFQPFKAKVLNVDDEGEDSDFDEGGQTAWQEVHLESDDEATSRANKQKPGVGKEGHLLAGAPEEPRQPSGEPKAHIRFQPKDDSLKESDDAVKGTISIELEEVLPRPQAGLLNRLLRLAKVERLHPSGQGPIFVIQPGKEYMVGLRLRQKDSSSRRICAKWLRIQPPDGQAVRFNVEEDSRKSSDWQGPFLASATNCALCIVQAYHANMKAA